MKITDIHRPYEKNPRHNEDAVEAVLDCVSGIRHLGRS